MIRLINKQIIAFLAMICILYSCDNVENNFLYNYKIADITPEDSVVLAGFAARKGLSTGIHKELKTHCLVLADGEKKICIVSNDLMEMSTSSVDDLREQISQKSGLPINNIFIHCIHTHSAPRTGGWCAKEGNPNYEYAIYAKKQIVNNAIETILDSESYKPFTMEIGKGKSDINCNRRDIDAYTSNDVYVLRLLDENHKPVLSLVNYACHPVSLGARSNVVSTDFPGFAADVLEKEWGGNVMYFSGASGNSDPCDSLSRLSSYAEAKGHKLANDIIDIDFTPVKSNGKFKVVNKEVKLPFQADTITVELIEEHVEEITKWGVSVSNSWVSDVKHWASYTIEDVKNGLVKNYLPFNIHAINIGGVVLFLTQGEPFMEYQAQLREEFPDTDILFIAYTNGQNSYLPSKIAFTSDKYDYETKQMHIYIGAPYPLSDKMPDCYSGALNEITREAIEN